MKLKLTFILTIISIHLWGKDSLKLSFSKTSLNDSQSLVENFQIWKDSNLVFAWEEIMGKVILEEKNSFYEFDCYIKSIASIKDTIQYIDKRVCKVLVNTSRDSFKITIENKFFLMEEDVDSIFNRLYQSSRNIRSDSLLSNEQLFDYYKLAESLAKSMLNANALNVKRLLNFYELFPFISHNLATTEFPSCLILGKTILNYFLD